MTKDEIIQSLEFISDRPYLTGSEAKLIVKTITLITSQDNRIEELERVERVFDEAIDEANHGRQKYGSGPDDFEHDDQHSQEDWNSFIDSKLMDAVTATPQEWRHKMIQIIGLATSAVLSFDRKAIDTALKQTATDSKASTPHQ